MPTGFAFQLDGLVDISKAGINFPSVGLQLAGASKSNGPAPSSSALHCDDHFDGFTRIQRFFVGYRKLDPALGDHLFLDNSPAIHVV